MVEQWPEIIERVFSLKRLSAYGKHIILSFGLALLIAFVIINLSDSSDGKRVSKVQYLSVDAVQVKRNTKYFHQFLKQVKSNNGFLVLGTSESGGLGGANYWHWWNGDQDINRKMSVLSGAGRRADVYFPHLAASPKAWENVDVLLFVNPTYWRNKLNEPRKIYQSRYVDHGLLHSQKRKLKAYDAFRFYRELLGLKEVLKDRINAVGYYTDQVHAYFYNDLRLAMGIKDLPYNLRVEAFDSMQNPEQYLQKIDTAFNVSNAFRKKHEKLNFPAVDTAQTYSSDLLSTFIQMSQDAGVNLTVIIGPYNQFLADKLGNEELIEPYEELHEAMLDTLGKYQVHSIDLWGLSDENNTFRDYQHHSQYGGYLIYKELKSQLNEEN